MNVALNGPKFWVIHNQFPVNKKAALSAFTLTKRLSDLHTSIPSAPPGHP
jgi:hypothetical protein